MWGLQCVGVAVCGSCGLRGCGVSGLQCEGVVVSGSQDVKGCGVGELL